MMRSFQNWRDQEASGHEFNREIPHLLINETEFREIQAEALEHACQLLTANADSPKRGFNSVFNEMLKLKPNAKVAHGEGDIENKNKPESPLGSPHC